MVHNLRLTDPGGVLAVYMTGGGGGSEGASYCEQKTIHEPEILHPKKYLVPKFLTKNIQDLNNSIPTYSTKQT